MKKKGLAGFLACTLLCTVLSSCAGYSGEELHPSQNGITSNLAHANVTELLANGKTRTSPKASDGNENTSFRSSADHGIMEMDFGGWITFNTVVLKEKGWNIQKYHLDVYARDESGKAEWKTVYAGERIEDLRYCALEESVSACKLRLVVDSASQIYSIREMEVYEVAPKDKKDFRVSAYIRTDLLLDGSILDQKEQTKIDPKFLDVVTELNLIGCISATPQGTIQIERTQTGADGKETSVPVSDAEFKASLDKLRQMIGSRGVELTATVYVGTPEDAVTGMTKNRDTLVKNTAEFLNKFGLNGVSYDWERPQNQEQFDIFSDYLIALRPELNKTGKRLTLAWAPWGVNMKPEAVKTADAIEMMTYDLFDQYGNQASFTESTVQAVDYFLSLGYQPEQLHIGLPYYGRPENGGEFWPSYNDPNYRFGKYDDTDSDYVLTYGKSYFNGCQTVMDKTAYAIAKGLGGIMVFRLELDRPYDDDVSLTKAIGKTIEQRIAQPEGGAKS